MMFSKLLPDVFQGKKKKRILPDEQSHPIDEAAQLQIVPVKDAVQNATYQQTEFIEGIVRALNLIAEHAYDPYAVHEHVFELKTYDNIFSCKICKEDGYGSRYKCYGDCPYEMHEECKNPRATITPDIFDESFTFELSDRPYKANPCNACGASVCGRFYHCKENGVNLHPRCGSLKVKIFDSGQCFNLRMKSSNVCIWCKGKDTGAKSWLYECTVDPSCCFHVRFVMEMMREAWKRSKSLPNTGALSKAVLKNKSKGNSGGFMKIARILLEVVIAAILLGVPMAVTVSTIVGCLK